MTEKPLVSVIINCYNSEKYLRETIDSLIAQTYENWEAIFWDNCSTDKTGEIIVSYNESRFRYFLAGKNTPLGEARNLAMENIQGGFFCFLDSDDVWVPTFLETGMLALQKEPRCAGFYSNYYNWYDGIAKSENNKGWSDNIHGLKFVLKNYGIAMSGAICRNEVAKDNPIRFNPNYSLVEDMDFFFQFLAFGDFIYDAHPLVFYRVYTENTTHRMRDRWAKEYADLYKRMYNQFVNIDNPKLSEEDLSYIKIQDLSCRAEELVFQNKRVDLIKLLFQNRKTIPFRYCWSRIVFILLGQWGYATINKIKKVLR